MEMKHIYMSLSITDYNSPFLGTECRFWEAVDGGEMTCRKLPLQEARKLMWELVLAGGEKKLSINYLNPKINTREVTYWMCH